MNDAPTALERSHGGRRPRGRGAQLALAAGLLVATTGRAGPLRQAADATTELEVDRAAELLATVDSDAGAVAIQRARLAVYRGDCRSATVTLETLEIEDAPELSLLREVAQTCARATAGATIVEDAAQGVWIRLQDARDRALVPFLTATAVAARAHLEHELGMVLPRPLRIELVRDLFSLSALTGLPVEAAETTGTVGVARWGRVVLLSPRATPRGYPWEDTLAHELVHLFVTRATRDHAPLWLQEGTAKQHEARWRPPRPFDDQTDHDAVARAALRSGRAVGIDGLGRSIALLPTPEQAATAYSEVTSFVGYLHAEQGAPAQRLLFADLRGLGGDPHDHALRSVTGYDLAVWRARWERSLLAEPDPPEPPPAHPVLSVKAVLEVRDLVRRVRLSELLARRGHHGAAGVELGPTLGTHAREPSLRWRAARAAVGAGQLEAAREILGDLDDIDSVHGGWFALHGRFASEGKVLATGETAAEIAVAVDPLLEDVACLGYPTLVPPPSPGAGPGPAEGSAADPTAPAPAASAPLPAAEPWRSLCRAARAVPRD